MSDVPSITVGHLKEIWKQHNVSDDDTIAFHFTKDKECTEIEFDRLYKREFGIVMDFKTSTIEDDEPSDDEMMSAFGTKWHDAL